MVHISAVRFFFDNRWLHVTHSIFCLYRKLLVLHHSVVDLDFCSSEATLTRVSASNCPHAYVCQKASKRRLACDDKFGVGRMGSRPKIFFRLSKPEDERIDSPYGNRGRGEQAA